MQAHDTYAFQAREIQTLGSLARAARGWGAFSLVLGTLGLVVVVPTITLFGRRSYVELLTALGLAAFAAVGVLAGTSYVKAARELHRVRDAGSAAPELAVRGFDALGRAFRVEAIVTGMSISLAFAGGLVLGALRNV